MGINTGSLLDRFYKKLALPLVAYAAVGCTSHQPKQEIPKREIQIPYKVTEEDLRLVHTVGPSVIHRSLKLEANFGHKVKQEYFDQFMVMAKEAKAEIEKAGLAVKKSYSKDEAKQILGIFSQIIEKNLKRADDPLILITAFKNKEYNCYPGSLLIQGLNEFVLAYPLDLKFSLAPQHIFIRCNLLNDSFNWEITLKGKDRTFNNANYINLLNITGGEVYRGNYLKELSSDEALSTQIMQAPGLSSKKGLRMYTIASHLDPNNAIAYHNRAVILDRLGRVDLAIRDLDKAIKINPDYKDAYYIRAKINFLNFEKDDLSIKDLSTVISLDPKYEKAYYYRARVYKHNNLYEQALKDISKAIELNPKSEIYYKFRSDLYTKMGLNDLADKDLTTYTELSKK